MTLHKSLTAFIERLEVEGYAQRTLEKHRFNLGYLLRYLDGQKVYSVQEITAKQVLFFQLQLRQKDLQARTIRDILWSLRRFFSYLYEEGFILQNFALDIYTIRKPKLLPKKILSQKQVKHLLRSADPETDQGIRDRAVLELLYSSGLRREEVCRLKPYDIDWPERTVNVIGKGNKERIVPVGQTALMWIEKYLKQVHGSYVQKRNDPYLFISLKTGKPLSPGGITGIVNRCSRGNGGVVSPHALRHACATHLLQNGANIRMIQEFLGHDRLSSTQVYTRVVIKDLKRVVDLFHPRRLISA